MNPFHAITNVVRAKDISVVLVRNGFLEFLEQIEAPSSWFSRFIPHKENKLGTWQRVRITAEELGPTFVKFAQVLSARPDVLPQPLIEELKLLRSQVKPVPWESIRPLLEHELKGTVEDVFAEFNPEPVAAGSIAQVYKARLKTGESVAIKVQRPGILKEIKADLEIVSWFAVKMQAQLPELKPYDLPAVVEEAREGMMRELDFSIEGRNTTFFNATNPFPTEVFSPKVYEAFTTKRLLVLEWIDGVPPEKVTLMAEERKRIATAGGRSVFHQIIIAGFFHADPHTGNLLVTPDGRLCFLDWGLAGQLTRHMRYFLADLFSGVASQNSEKVVQVALANAVTRRRVDSTRLEKEISVVLRKYPHFEAGSEAIGRMMLDLLHVLGSNGIQLARDYALLAKAVIAIEDAGKTLDPDFDIRDVSRSFLRDLNVERWHPKTLTSLGYWSVRATLRQMRELPGTMQRILRNLEEGEASINFVHKGLDGVRASFESGINRLVLAIIIAAILISSAMIIRGAGVENLYTFPYDIGTFGFLFAVLFGLWLLYETARGSRRK